MDLLRCTVRPVQTSCDFRQQVTSTCLPLKSKLNSCLCRTPERKTLLKVSMFSSLSRSVCVLQFHRVQIQDSCLVTAGENTTFPVMLLHFVSGDSLTVLDEDALLRSFVASHIPRFFAKKRRKKEENGDITWLRSLLSRAWAAEIVT